MMFWNLAGLHQVAGMLVPADFEVGQYLARKKKMETSVCYPAHQKLLALSSNAQRPHCCSRTHGVDVLEN